MKKIKIMIAAVCLLFAFSFTATAQKGILKLNLNYNYSIPLSGFKSDLISNASAQGFNGELMYQFNNKLSGGLLFGYQDYYQKYPRAIYSLSKTQDISAVLSNSIHSTPVLLKAKYSFLHKTGSFINPYVSLGAGINMIDFKQYFGEFASSETNVGFLAQGGLGVMIPFGKLNSSGINLGADYDYSPYKKFGYSDLNTVNFHAGVFFAVR